MSYRVVTDPSRLASGKTDHTATSLFLHYVRAWASPLPCTYFVCTGRYAQEPHELWLSLKRLQLLLTRQVSLGSVVNTPGRRYIAHQCAVSTYCSHLMRLLELLAKGFSEVMYYSFQQAIFKLDAIQDAGLGGSVPFAHLTASGPRTNSILPPLANTSPQVTQALSQSSPFTFRLCT